MFRLAAVLTVVLMGCATAPSKLGELAQETDEGAVPFHMVVSNQSFEDDCVFIDVTVDGTHIIEGNFDVEDQHSFHDFDFYLLPGQHTLRATSDTGITLERTFTVSQETWGTLSYWAYDSDIAPSEFNFTTHSQRPGFG